MKDYKMFLNKKCIVHLKDGTNVKGFVDIVVNNGDDDPDEQYIGITSKGSGYYFDEIEYIEEIKWKNVIWFQNINTIDGIESVIWNVICKYKD